jgi:hypothetical protein
VAQAHVGKPDYQLQVRIELLDAQRGANVAGVVLIDQRQRIGPVHPGAAVGGRLGCLNQVHPRQCSDARTVIAPTGPNDPVASTPKCSTSSATTR